MELDIERARNLLSQDSEGSDPTEICGLEDRLRAAGYIWFAHRLWALATAIQYRQLLAQRREQQI